MSQLMLLYVAAGLLVVGLALALISRKIPPNALYGFRLEQAMQDSRIWYAVNRHFGWRFLITGIAVVPAAIGFYLVPGIGVDAYALTCLGGFLLFFIPGVVQSYCYMRRLAGPAGT
jgi:uncharacterized membrane protein